MLEVSCYNVWSVKSLSDIGSVVYRVPLEIKANLGPQMLLKAP